MHQLIQSGHRNRDIRVLCTHVIEQTLSTPAHPCGSPALGGESFCFYHHPDRQHGLNRNQCRARARALRIARKTVTVPLPTTRHELLGSLHRVMILIAADQIDLRHAGVLLAALNRAGENLPE